MKTLKQKAERGFVEALTRFHYRRDGLEKQKTKFNKENPKTCIYLPLSLSLYTYIFCRFAMPIKLNQITEVDLICC